MAGSSVMEDDEARERTRTPRGVPGVSPLRWDAPSRRAGRRGAAPQLRTGQQRDAALAALDAGMYAASSWPGLRSRRAFIARTLNQWGLSPEPITYLKVR